MPTHLTRLFSLCFAIASFGCSIAAEKETLRRQLDQACDDEACGNYRPAARIIFEKSAAENPTSAEAWAALGEHYRFYVHDEIAAAKAFKKAMSSGKQIPIPPHSHCAVWARSN